MPGVFQKISKTYSTNVSQCTGAECCSRVPIDSIDASRKPLAASIFLLLESRDFFLGATDL